MPTFNGTSGNDTIDGSSGADSIYGLAGNDRIRTGDGDDYVEGGDGDDEINGYPTASGRSYWPYSGKKTVKGGAGKDFIVGGSSSDRLFGDDGDDTLYGDDGDDSLDGGEGNDKLYGGDGNDTFSGGAGNDTLYGDAGNDSLDGGIGDDTLFGGDGADTLVGWAGADYLDGGAGNDSLDGGVGDDTLYGGEGADTLAGGDGNDTISKYLKSGNSTLLGGAGSDTIWGGNGNDSIDGGEGDDSWLEGYDGDDTIRGGSGSDKLYGSKGDDRLFGDAGSDSLYGGDGNDSLEGGDGDDSLNGGAGTNVLQGGNGNDSLVAQETGNDTLLGGDGDDKLNAYTGLGNKLLDGGAGDDSLYGGIGNDSIIGGDGNDSLVGDEGNDTLDGGAGVDTLQGGEGNDTYIIRNSTQQIYDTGGNDSAHVYTNFVKIPSYIENVYYAQGVQALPYWIDALIYDSASGSAFSTILGTSQTFKYTFPAVIPSYYATDPEDSKGWAPFSATQQARALVALDYIASVVNLKFSQTTESNAPNTITFANNDQSKSAGYARIPSSTAKGSDLFLDNSNNSQNERLSDGSYGALTLIHELGHALGLKHPFSAPDADGDIPDPPYLTGTEDSTRWTVMSYTSSSAEYLIRFSALDIAALHYLYGPSQTARTGNDTYNISTSEPNFIWDGAGIDTISASTANAGCTIYLTPGYWGYAGGEKAARITSAGQITVNFGTVIENLVGSAFADALFGNSTANSISGGAGNDTLNGEAGDDQLIGGDGIDTAVYSGSSSGYKLLLSNNTLRIQDRTGIDGTDTLGQIERLQFSNKSVIVESRAHSGFSDIPASMYQFFILAFGAAPGVEYLQQCADAYRAGASIRVITNVFTTKSQFTDTYPTSLSNRELATKLIRNVVGNSASESSKAQAIIDISAALDGGLSVGNMIFTVFSNLAAKPLSGDEWSGTAKLFQNQIAVGKYYTETMNQSTTDLATLRTAISAVTPTSDVSTETSIVSLIGLGLLGG